MENIKKYKWILLISFLAASIGISYFILNKNSVPMDTVNNNNSVKTDSLEEANASLRVEKDLNNQTVTLYATSNKSAVSADIYFVMPENVKMSEITSKSYFTDAFINVTNEGVTFYTAILDPTVRPAPMTSETAIATIKFENFNDLEDVTVDIQKSSLSTDTSEEVRFTLK